MHIRSLSPRIPRPGRIVAQATRWLAVALCKLALLVILLPFSMESEAKASSSQEGAVSLECGGFQKRDRVRRQSPLTAVVCNSPAGQSRIRSAASACRCVAPATQGHFLANGLLAPLTC